MYLSDRDLMFALESKQLLIDPAPTGDDIDTTGIDLHLDSADEARVWDVAAFHAAQGRAGKDGALGVGKFHFKSFAADYSRPVPQEQDAPTGCAYRDGGTIYLPPHAFLLWQTKQVVGTPEKDPRLICFIDGKSTRARTGLLVHMTAPTIHARWAGQVTLEIGNLRPFTLSLRAGDAVAQIVVALISSPPIKVKSAKGIDQGQKKVTGTG